MFDFDRIGDFGQRLSAAGGHRDQEQPIANANELHRLPAGERRAAEEFDGFLRQLCRACRGETLRAPDEGEEHAENDRQTADNGADGGCGRRSGRFVQRAIRCAIARSEAEWLVRRRLATLDRFGRRNLSKRERWYLALRRVLLRQRTSGSQPAVSKCREWSESGSHPCEICDVMRRGGRYRGCENMWRAGCVSAPIVQRV